jgi:hypothetical protein
MSTNISREEWNKLFKIFKVKMLVRIKGSGVGAGKIAYGSTRPNGRIYLSATANEDLTAMGKVFSTDAIEGIDFIIL